MRFPAMLMIVGCSVLSVGGLALLPVAPATAQAIQTPWKLTITTKGTAGRSIQVKDAYGNMEKMEAAGQWVGIDLSFKNTSGTRRSAKDVFAIGTAKLIDGAGNTYDVDRDASPSAYGDELDKKPFEPGESRAIRLYFDTPKTAKIQRLSILGDDIKGEIQEFMVKF
jgi:Domain of unknown function (DUF4352)